MESNRGLNRRQAFRKIGMTAAVVSGMGVSAGNAAAVTDKKRQSPESYQENIAIEIRHSHKQILKERRKRSES